MIWALFILSVLLVAMAVSQLFFAWQSPSWPTTNGRVVRSEVIEIKANSRTFFRPVVIYEYAVDGKTRRSMRLGLFLYTAGKDWANQIVRGYEVGKDVRVFYHPWLHSFCILQPGIQQPLGWIVLAAMGALLAVGPAIALFADDPHMLMNAAFGLIRRVTE